MSSTSPVGGCVFHFFVKKPLTGLVHCSEAGNRHYSEAPKLRIITAFGGFWFLSFDSDVLHNTSWRIFQVDIIFGDYLTIEYFTRFPYFCTESKPKFSNFSTKPRIVAYAALPKSRSISFLLHVFGTNPGGAGHGGGNAQYTLCVYMNIPFVKHNLNTTSSIPSMMFVKHTFDYFN